MLARIVFIIWTLFVGLILIVGLLTWTGCTTVIVDRKPDGSCSIHNAGAPFVSRGGTVEVTDSWLGADNILHQGTIRVSTDENANDQLEMARLIAELAAKGAAAGVAK